MKTLGQIDYEAFAAAIKLTAPWGRLSAQNKEAWEQAARMVVTAKSFLTEGIK